MEFSFKITTILILLLLAIFYNCSKNDGIKITQSNPTTTQTSALVTKNLTVENVFPKNGQNNFSPFYPIKIEFSDEILSSNLSDRISVKNNENTIDISLSISSKTVLIYPKPLFPPGKTLTLKIDKSVKSTNNNSLKEDFIHSFSTVSFENMIDLSKISLKDYLIDLHSTRKTAKETDLYVPLSITEYNNLVDIFTKLYSGNFDVKSSLDKLNYELIYLYDKLKSHHYILCIEKPDIKFYRSWVLINFNEKSNLVFGVPHSIYELNTLQLSIDAFEELMGHSLIFNVAHRCSNFDYTTCDGKTTVCSPGTEDKYRESDVAHNVMTVFHMVHDVIFQQKDYSIFFSIHGFKSNTGEPVIHISDGTNENKSDSYITNLLKANLINEINNSQIVVSSCNSESDDPIEKLCGSTNVQGRKINNPQEEPCNTYNAVSSGKFIHLELSGDLRSEGGTVYPSMLINAIRETFID